MKSLIKSRRRPPAAAGPPGSAQSQSTSSTVDTRVRSSWSSSSAGALVVETMAGEGRNNPFRRRRRHRQRPDGLSGRAKLLFTELCRTTSAHGLVNLVQAGVHFIERTLWIFCILAACFGAASLSSRVWLRYQSSPTVITMDRNKFFWNTTFPSLTMCPHKKIDDNKLRRYFDENPSRFPGEEDRQAFAAFIQQLSNSTFETFNEIPELNSTYGVKPEDYMELVHNLTLHFSPDLTSGTSYKLYLQETITELGICYAVNSRVAVYNSFRVWKQNNWSPIETPETVVVHPLDGEIYANSINISTSYSVFFHGAMEVPDISKQRYSFGESDYSTVELQALEIITGEDAKALTISQRKCRFTSEARNLVTSAAYSYNFCRMECRLMLALRLCNCIPYFYRPRGKDGRKFRVCDFQGMQCLYRNRNDLLSLQPPDTTAPGGGSGSQAATGTTASKKSFGQRQQQQQQKIWCKCDRNCDDSNFFLQDLRSRVWFLGANLQWGINDYPKLQLRRNVLFRFEDLLVYMGGTAGLFLGCSLLSFTEFIFFFTWRFVKLFFAGDGGGDGDRQMQRELAEPRDEDSSAGPPADPFSAQLMYPSPK